jgi:hypothetical protein
MPRSIHVVASAALVLLACAQTSQQPAAVTAPTASTAASDSPEQASATPVAASSPPTSPVPAAEADGGLAAQYRSCQADADCVAVPRAGCCHNGWKEAVNSSQKDAYEQANACASTRRPICPMFMVRDTRVARCDGQSHLCEMVKP